MQTAADAHVLYVYKTLRDDRGQTDVGERSEKVKKTVR